MERQTSLAEALSLSVVFVDGLASFVSFIGSMYWASELSIAASDLLVGFAMYSVGTLISTFGRQTNMGHFRAMQGQLLFSVVGYMLLAMSSTFSMWIVASMVVGAAKPMCVAYVLHVSIGQKDFSLEDAEETNAGQEKRKHRAMRSNKHIGSAFALSALASLLIMVERFVHNPQSVFWFLSSVYASLFCCSCVVSYLPGHKQFVYSLVQSKSGNLAKLADKDGLLQVDKQLSGKAAVLRNVALLGEFAAVFTRTSLLTHSAWGVLALDLVERNEQLIYHSLVFGIDLLFTIRQSQAPNKPAEFLSMQVTDRTFDRVFVIGVLSAGLVLCHLLSVSVYQFGTPLTLGIALLSMHSDRTIYQDVVYTTQVSCAMSVVPFAYMWATVYIAAQAFAMCVAVVVVFSYGHTPLVYLAVVNGAIYFVQMCVLSCES